MATLLVLAETDGSQILPTTLPAIAFAQEWAREMGGTFDLLVLLGAPMADADLWEEWRTWGAGQIVRVERPEFTHPVAEQVAATCVQVMRQGQATSVAGTASSFGRDVLPRVAGLLDVPMVSDVMQVCKTEHGLRCRRPADAGRAVATVQVTGADAVFSVRGASYGKPKQTAPVSRNVLLEMNDIPPARATWVSLQTGVLGRPALGEARVVVAGGRPLRDAATFERLIGGLADALGGAVGATGGATGAELAPPELLIGQTGQTVAPELYIAAGISGSDQHVAGMRDSRVIVAINTDPQAAIFGVADYGLVADVHAALPELTDRLARQDARMVRRSGDAGNWTDLPG